MTATIPAVRRTRTAQECADTLGISIDLIRDLLASGALKGRKFGNRWLVLDAELEAFMEREMRTGGTA
jgi:excisionase family DNA binding protein